MTATRAAFNQTSHSVLWIAIGLALALCLTRGPALPGLSCLADASWAVFFLAGIYLPSIAVPVAALALTWMVDWFAIVWAEVDPFCLSPAYALLIPAYISLWLGGRYCAIYTPNFNTRHILPMALYLATSAFVCEVLSSGGFYLLSGHFESPNWPQLGQRLWRYFPANLATIFAYVACFIGLHWVAASLRPEHWWRPSV